jgi:hypothetical protein
VQGATKLNQPIVTPPDDWQDRPACVGKSIDFTPDLKDPNHQRKIMQREYVASRRWRRSTNPRSLVEGAFGILKNPSRQRLRRGQNRLPGLAMATIVAAVKISVFNEEQLRIWHAETGKGPADHPLLQLDQPDWGFRNLSQADAEAVDEHFLSGLPTAAETDEERDIAA